MSRAVETLSPTDGQTCERFFEAVSSFALLRAVKLYRLTVTLDDPLPVLPCLDHEALLHEGISPHAAAYIEDLDGGGLHEVVCVPARRRIEVDTVSTAGEHTDASHQRLLARLRDLFPDHTIVEIGPSWLRGDRRVARACRAQVPLRDILVARDYDRLRRSVDRLATIGALMEKQSRVASWSVRTVTGPMLALGGFVSYQVLGALTGQIGAEWVQWLRYASVGGLGATFLYLGLKAVHLTEIANRVWKRCAEYGLLLSERQRREVVPLAVPSPARVPVASSRASG